MKSTAKKLKELIKDEIKSSKDYSKRGFKSLAKDEKRHAKFLKKQLSKNLKWKTSR